MSHFYFAALNTLKYLFIWLLVNAFLQDVELFVFERHLVDRRRKDNHHIYIMQ